MSSALRPPVDVGDGASAPSGARRLVELRGVGGHYPLAGKVTFTGAPSLAAALADRPDGHGALVEQALLDRLGLKLGDAFLAGNLPLVATAVLERIGFRVIEVTAILHCPRVLAVPVARLADAAGPRWPPRLLRTLARFEHADRWPTRFRTGHFVAVLSEKDDTARPRT